MYKIEYQVNVKYLDDGMHLPVIGYSGWFYPETSLDNVEIKKAVLEDVRKNYERNTGRTLEKDMADPAFVGVTAYGITVCRSVDNVGAYIDGPAKGKE